MIRLSRLYFLTLSAILLTSPSHARSDFDKTFRELSVSVFYSMPEGPGFGLRYSYPFFYDFLHLDFYSDCSFPSFFEYEGRYIGMDRDSINILHVSEHSNIHGVSIFAGIGTTIFLKRFLLGFNAGCNVKIYKEDFYYYAKDIHSNKFIYEHKMNDCSAADFEGRVIAFAGYHYKRFDIRLYYWPFKLSAQYALTRKNHRKLKIKQCIDYSSRRHRVKSMY